MTNPHRASLAAPVRDSGSPSPRVPVVTLIAAAGYALAWITGLSV